MYGSPLGSASEHAARAGTRPGIGRVSIRAISPTRGASIGPATRLAIRPVPIQASSSVPLPAIAPVPGPAICVATGRSICPVPPPATRPATGLAALLPFRPPDTLKRRLLCREALMAQQGYGQHPGPSGQSGQSGDKGFVDKAWDAQRKLEQRTRRITSGRYARVLRMARKPEPEEFRRTSIIVAVGLMVIGLIGFVILQLVVAVNDLLGIR